MNSTIRLSFSRKEVTFCAMLLALALLLSACEKDPPPIASKKHTQSDDLFIQFIDRPPRTDWYGIYMQGHKIGHGKLSTGRYKGSDGTIYKVFLSGTLRFQSLKEIVSRTISYDAEFDPHPPYTLKRCSQRMASNDDVSEITVFETPDGYQARILQGNEIRTQMIGPLDYTLKHGLAVVTWVQEEPEVGDSIKFQDLNLETLKTDTGTARIKAINDTIVGGVKVKSYEVVSTDADGLESVEFLGADGTTYSVGLGEFFKFQLEPKALAMKLDKPIDLFLNNIVAVDRALGEPGKVIRLQLAIDEMSGALITDAPGQTIKRDVQNKRYVVTLNPEGNHPIKATDEEIKKNLRATTDIPVDHPKVVALAKQAVGDAKTTTQKVARLIKFVDKYVENDYMPDPLTVLDILDEQKGDCSSHSALFTAMARSQGVPCRRVSGLVYLGDESRGFGQHAWNEVVIDGAWISVDPTWGQTRIDATHLRFPVDMNEEWQVIATVPKMKMTVLEVDLGSRSDEQGDTEELVEQGLNWMDQFKFDKAINSFEAAIKLHPDDASIYCYLGASYIWYLRTNIKISLKKDKTQKNDILKKAKKTYLRSLELSPMNICALEGLGEYYRYVSDYQSALIQYQELARQQPENKKIYREIGQVYIALDQPQLAKEAFSVFLKGRPRSLDYAKDYELTFSTLFGQAHIQNRIKWHVTDPTIYEGTLGDSKLAETRIKDLCYPCMRVVTDTPELLSENSRVCILQRANGYLKKRFGIEILETDITLLDNT